MTDTDFLRLKKTAARNAVFLGLEEKFDLLINNYEELELDVLRLPLREMIHPNMADWSALAGDRMLLTRRIVNILTTSRLYTDQIKGDLSVLYGGLESAPVDPRPLFSAEYDARLGFRVMESLRNHFQHQSLPVQGIYHNSHWDDQYEPSLLRFAVGVRLNLDELRTSDSFKASVLEELDAMDKKDIELIGFVRTYIEGLGKVHEQLRTALAHDVAEVDTTISEFLERWRALSDSPLGLVALQKDDSGSVTDKVYIAANFTRRRQELVRRNAVMGTLARRFVTGQRVRPVT